ncbi:unnamed protein product [Oncorhynchus mykiss]|uniref:Uncharacterized protein n=1 Tax=Oncorhynchus mykiss TaxID=8022 RepID=A0A060W607_ONCMY|nr:unnamed protein product [Oncorhynchus mykiss]
MNRQVEYDSYEIEEPSDEERAEDSSEDELDVLLNGTPDQKRKLIREYLTGESESSSGDEFEKEMEAELSTTIKTMECKWAPPTAPAECGGVMFPVKVAPLSINNIVLLGPPVWRSVAQPEPGLEPHRTSLEGPENSCVEMLPIQPDRAWDRAWEDLQRRMGETSEIHYPRRLKAIIAAKGASTKYCVKGLNTYVNVHFI